MRFFEALNIRKPDYDSDNVSLKVVRIIPSHTDYVNQTVWFK